MHHTVRMLSVVVAGALALGGCAASGDDDPAQSTTPAPTTSTAAPTSPSASPTAEGIDTSDWLTYTTVEGAMSYRHPADWMLQSSVDQNLEIDDARYDSSTLTAPNGQTLLHSADFADIGGMCEAPLTGTVLYQEPAQVTGLDGEPAVIAAIAFDGDPMVFGAGIASSDYLGDGEFACPFDFVFATRAEPTSMGTHLGVSNDDPLWNIDSIDDARAYMETDEYATILEILRSVQTP